MLLLLDLRDHMWVVLGVMRGSFEISHPISIGLSESRCQAQASHHPRELGLRHGLRLLMGADGERRMPPGLSLMPYASFRGENQGFYLLFTL